MTIYIVTLCIMPFWGLIKNKKASVLLSSLCIFLVLALRDITVGMDMANYYGGYEYIASLSFHDIISRLRFVSVARLVYPYSYESGYAFFNWIVAKCGLSFHGFIVVTSLIIALSIGVFIYRYSENTWMSFVLYIGLGMYLYSFGIQRQSIAVSILLWSLPCIYDRKMWKFIIFCIIAFTFHRSSALFVIMYPLYNRKLTKNFVRMFLLGCLFLIGVARYIYNSFIGRVLDLLGKLRYTEVVFEYNNQIVLMFGIIILVLLLADFRIFEDKKRKLALWGMLFSIPVEIMGMCNEVFARSVEYFYIFAIVLIPTIITNYRIFEKDYSVEKQNHTMHRVPVLVISYTLIFIAMIWFTIHQLDGTPLIPYVFYKKY